MPICAPIDRPFGFACAESIPPTLPPSKENFGLPETPGAAYPSAMAASRKALALRRFRARHADHRRVELFLSQELAEQIVGCASRWGITVTEASVLLLEPGLHHVAGALSYNDAVRRGLEVHR